ncbi:MAG: wax ester/triacylglycerol synthase domain-containing protein [Acidimicrobiia bacterium]
MSPSEAVMWAVEKDPALRSDFCNVTVLDRPPSPQRLRATVDRALAAIPRLGERVVSPPLRLAPPEWRPDPTFDIDYHVRHVAIPSPGSMRAFLDVAAATTAPPLDRSRPLWEFTVVEGLEGGRAALLQRLHHTITDGVGGMRLSLSLVDLEREPAPDVHDAIRSLADDVQTERRDATTGDPVDRDSPLDIVREAVADRGAEALDLARHAAGMTARMLLRPQGIPGRVRSAGELLASLRRQVLITDRGHSEMFAHRSLARRYDALGIPLDPLHRAGKAHGASVNDVFVTGVTRALARFHHEFGEAPDQLRMAMPVSTRDRGDVAANRFAPSRVLVPAAVADVTEHLLAVHTTLGTIRREPALEATDVLAAATVGVPTAVLVSLLRAQTRTIDFATSNLRGSPVDLFLGGAKIEASYPMGPRAGVPVNVTMMSYCGELHLGIHSDPAAVIDPDLFLDCLRESFAELAALG